MFAYHFVTLSDIDEKICVGVFNLCNFLKSDDWEVIDYASFGEVVCTGIWMSVTTQGNIRHIYTTTPKNPVNVKLEAPWSPYKLQFRKLMCPHLFMYLYHNSTTQYGT